MRASKLSLFFVLQVALILAFAGRAAALSLVCDLYPAEQKVDSHDVQLDINGEIEPVRTIPIVIEKGYSVVMRLDHLPPGKYRFKVWSRGGDDTAGPALFPADGSFWTKEEVFPPTAPANVRVVGLQLVCDPYDPRQKIDSHDININGRLRNVAVVEENGYAVIMDLKKLTPGNYKFKIWARSANEIGAPALFPADGSYWVRRSAPPKPSGLRISSE